VVRFVLVRKIVQFFKFSRLILNIKLSLASWCPYLPILVN
jgi:hypothetical protein